MRRWWLLLARRDRRSVERAERETRAQTRRVLLWQGDRRALDQFDRAMATVDAADSLERSAWAALAVSTDGVCELCGSVTVYDAIQGAVDALVRRNTRHGRGTRIALTVVAKGGPGVREGLLRGRVGEVVDADAVRKNKRWLD